MNNYDQIYPYSKILLEVRDLILPTIMDHINPADIAATKLKKNDLAEIVYSQIMALGYNNGDVNAAVNDLMPNRNPIVYPGAAPLEAVNMAMQLTIIIEDFKHQVWAFQGFHKNTQELKPHKEVVIEVKKQLLAIELGF